MKWLNKKGGSKEGGSAKSFSAFWPRVNWSESKNPPLRGVFALAPIYARSECGKVLFTGTLATQASTIPIRIFPQSRNFDGFYWLIQMSVIFSLIPCIN